MSQFRPALEAFIDGNTDMPSLQRELKSDLSREPTLAPVLSALIESTYREGRIAGPTYLDLIEVVRATTPPAVPPAKAPSPPPDPDATRYRPSGDGNEGETLYRPDLETSLSPNAAPPPRKLADQTGSSTGSKTGGDLTKIAGATGRELRPGDVVKDRFVLEDIIGKSGMAVVLRA